jgi:Chaperone of endosialidase
MKLLRLEKTPLLTRKSINRSALRSGLFLAALALAYSALSPITQAVTPPPVGGYRGQNTATGDYALFNLTTGTRNTAIGFQALNTNTTGGKNTAIGFLALQDNPTGTNNIALGYSAGIFTAGDNNINIGNVGAEESDTIRIGTVNGRGIRDFQRNTYIAGISGVTIAAGVPVMIDADGHLGSTTSSERFKDEVKPMDKASEAILALKPVTYRYKKELDPDGIPQFGLVAEQVEKVRPDLVARDKEGKPYSVRYEAVNAMLLNEFLKEHETVQDQGETIARLQKQIEALTVGLEKVNAQLAAASPSRGGLEVSKMMPRVVVKDQ